MSVAKTVHMDGSQAPPFACGAHKAGLRFEAQPTNFMLFAQMVAEVAVEVLTRA